VDKSFTDQFGSSHLRLEFLDTEERKEVFEQLKEDLPYGPCVLVREGNQFRIVDAPKET
jgi:hypothetical protein